MGMGSEVGRVGMGDGATGGLWPLLGCGGDLGAKNLGFGLILVDQV